MVSTNEIKKRLEARKSKQGFLLCDNCGGFYELQEEESPGDFETCQCGGKLKYGLYHDSAKEDDLDYQKLGTLQKKDVRIRETITTDKETKKIGKSEVKSDMWTDKSIKIADEELAKKIDELMSRTDIIIEQNNRIIELLKILTNNNINEGLLIGVCPSCGTKITDKAQYCQECGTKI
jgi:Mg2+ and Co2+ transporter CorA